LGLLPEEYNRMTERDRENYVMNEYMDILHTETRKLMISVNEADKNGILLSLTNKLYDQIMAKYDDIPMGDIPRSKGDIEKLPQLRNLKECIDTIRAVVIEYKQDTKNNVDILSEAYENFTRHKTTFIKGYTLHVELIQTLYETMLLALVSATSLMISACIEYVRVPNTDTFDVSLDKAALAKSRDNLLFNNLRKFNNFCADGTLEKVAESLFKKSGSKNLVGETILLGGLAVTVLILVVLPVLRELIYFFYRARVSVSDYFAVQSELLNANAYNVRYKESIVASEREVIKKKQLQTAESFKNISNLFAVKMTRAEKQTVSDISSENKKYKAEELINKAPDSTGDVLF
jgi:hypothetical protein